MSPSLYKSDIFVESCAFHSSYTWVRRKPDYNEEGGGKEEKDPFKRKEGTSSRSRLREVGHLPPLVGGGEGTAKREKKRTDTQQTIKHWVNWWRTSNNRSGTSWRHMQKRKVRGGKKMHA